MAGTDGGTYTAGDRIELEILRHKLAALTGEMGVTVANAAQSPEIAEQRDFAVGIADRHGGIVAIDNPLHLGSFALTAEATLRYFKFDMKGGDVVVVNDPYRGGTHVQDVTLIAPYAIDNTIVMYLIARGHMPDIGGQHAGGYNPTATEVWAEGVPVSPLKLQRFDRPVRDIKTTLLLNSRHPGVVDRNLDALLAALTLGRRRTDELVGGYGLERLRAALAYTQDYTERRTRAAIASWPDGAHRGARRLDHDGAGGEPVTVRVEATVSGDALALDFSESDAQRPSFVNSAFGSTVGQALVSLLALLGDDVPANGGLLRAVDVRCDEGRVVNPTRPAAVGWGPDHCGAEIAEACAIALRDVVGGDLGALTVPRPLVAMRPRERAHDRIGVTPLTAGGCSAAEGRDGWALPHVLSRAVLPSAEQWEAEHGRRVLGIELIADSAGAGRWRGAPGVETVIELRGDELLTLCTAGRDVPVDGIAGGRPGSSGDVALGSGPEDARSVAPTLVEEPATGRQLMVALGGGGGYGDPLERDAALVLDDVLDGVVSVVAARTQYGVVVVDGAVDEQSTAGERARRRKEEFDGR